MIMGFRMQFIRIWYVGCEGLVFDLKVLVSFLGDLWEFEVGFGKGWYFLCCVEEDLNCCFFGIEIVGQYYCLVCDCVVCWGF